MKLSQILVILLLSTQLYAKGTKLSGPATFFCGENEAIKVNMPSLGEAILECRKYGLQSGQSCAEDSECSSSCCDNFDKICRIHDPASNKFCSKAIGQTCKNDSYCQIVPITECLIISQGTDPFGNKICNLRCRTLPIHGVCKNRICTPPIEPQRPIFNPNDPNRCDNAVDLPDDWK